MNKLLLFATLKEAQATLKALNAEPDLSEKKVIFREGEVCSLYHYEEGLIALSGWGSEPALFTAARFLPLVDEVLNVGFAGALNDSHPLFSLHEISSVDKWQSAHLPTFSLAEEGHRLLTSPIPIHDNVLRKELGKKWDLVDMEGYGVAFAAAQLKKRCRLLKIVSDFASRDARQLIEKHQESLSELIAEKIYESSSHSRV